MKQDHGWQPASELTATHLGNPNRGCPHCGTVMRHHTPTGQTAYWPGTECCPPAIRRQIGWRTEQLDGLRKTITDRENAIREMQDEIETAPRSAQAQLLAKRDRAQRNLNAVMQDHYTPEIRTISREIARLRHRLTDLEAAA